MLKDKRFRIIFICMIELKGFNLKLYGYKY